MTDNLTQARQPAGGRRWIRALAALSALAVGLAGAAVSRSASAATDKPTDQYSLCLPSTPCMPAVQAMLSGTVAWNANTNVYRAATTGLPLVTVWFTEIDNGRATNLPPIRVLRGQPVNDSAQIQPATDALRISLCNGASLAPTPDCTTTTVTR